MAIELSRQALLGYQGRTFRVSREGMPTVDMELVDVNDLRRPGEKLPEHLRQEPFQLKFRGPAEPVLGQGIYTFSCEGEGELTLFMVPVGPNGNAIDYNVVVN